MVSSAADLGNWVGLAPIVVVVSCSAERNETEREVKCRRRGGRHPASSSMAAVAAERDLAQMMFRAAESCSVCLDAVNDCGERSIAKLKCGHHFHLDCIGSAFNAKGAMQCPNCRHVENGQWLYANGSRLSDEFSMDVNGSRLNDDFSIDAGIRLEEFSYEEDPNEAYPTSFFPFLVAPDSLTHFDWCPYQHGSLAAGGSSFEQQVHFSVPFRHDDGAVRILPEVVVNVSYNYNESRGAAAASSSPPVCPYLEAQARPSRGAAEDSRLRPPMLAGRPTRPLDPSGASNSGSSSSIGNGDLFSSRGNIWSPRLQSAYGHRTDPSIFGEQPRLSHMMDLPVLPRNSPTTAYGDTIGSGPSAPERSNSWTRTEIERPNNQYDSSVLGTYSAQHNHTELLTDGGGLSVGPPCPRPRFAHGQVGTSQSQPQSSSLRSAPTGNNRRARQNGITSSSSISGARTDTGHTTTGELNRRYSHSWTDLSLSLGPEPPVPGLESHGGSVLQTGGQSSVPWRRDSWTEGTSVGTPGQLWHPPARHSSGLTPTSSNFRHSDYIEGHGSSLGSTLDSSQPQSELEHYRSSLSSSLGLDGAGAGSSIPHRIHLPTPYTIPLRPR